MMSQSPSTLGPALRQSSNPNPISKYLCPSCGCKLITIDLLHIKQLYCAACNVKPCRDGATAPSFDEAMLKLDQNYENYISQLGDTTATDHEHTARKSNPPLS